VSEVPAEVQRLADERAAKRAEGEFAASDDLRDAIRELGWQVLDQEGGFDLEPVREEAPPLRIRAEKVPSILGEPPAGDVTVLWIHEGWTEDIVRGIASFRAVHGERRVQHVVAEATEAPPDAWPPDDDVEVLRLAGDPGFARARNASFLRARGRIVVVADGSIEATGDVLGPIEEALADPSVGVVGPFGLVAHDLEHLEESPGPDVDAIEGYLMAFRRELLERGLRYDSKFRFYRSADVDLSFQVKAMGLRAVRVELPVRRHTHRMWETTPPEKRWRLSRRNYYRFLDRFRGRTDLLVEPPTEA
jgi:cysteinyl-tRNA synthetase